MEQLKVSEAVQLLGSHANPAPGTPPEQWIAAIRRKLDEVRSRVRSSQDSDLVLALAAFLVAHQAALSVLASSRSAGAGGTAMPLRDAHRYVDLWTALESSWVTIADLSRNLDGASKLTPNDRILVGVALSRAGEVTGPLVQELLKAPASIRPSIAVDLLSDLEAGLRVAELGHAIRDEIGRLASEL